MVRTWIILCAILHGICMKPLKNEKSTLYWLEQGKNVLHNNLKLQRNTGVAKNIILFVGDGMGLTTIAAARILKGQLRGRDGEEELLSFEKFPHVALLKTYSIDFQVPDSAATATALLTGIKTKTKIISLDPSAKVGDCKGSKDKNLTTVVQWAQDAGKSTGIVTTTRITHATPAAGYAKSAHREWEGDTHLHGVTGNCKDIARQLVEDLPGKNINVLFGGGRKHFMSKNEYDKEEAKYGARLDNRNLMSDWAKDKEKRKVSYKVVTSQKQFNEIKDNTDYVLGLFEYGHMNFELDRKTDIAGEPSIAEMTVKAIRILKKNTKGFFLLVEGGRIDHGHHAGNAKRALSDTVALHEAVAAALKEVDPKETLVIVTADHSHVMTLNGYPPRGNSILGLAGSDADKFMYTSLLYTNGPGGYQRPSANITKEDATADNYTQVAAIPLKSETHGGEDVGVFAIGPMAHLFNGVQEQNYVAHVMAYAACIGPSKGNLCETDRSAAVSMKYSSILIILLLIFLLER